MKSSRLFDEEFLRRLQRLHLTAKRISASSLAGGQRLGRRLGDGLEFADHRAYTPGDDIRFLDWPYFARMERLLIRLFHEHSESTVAILLDRSASMDLGEVNKFDHARRTAAALAYVSMAGLDRVRIVPFSESLDEGILTGRNRGQVVQVLSFLEALAPAGRTNLLGCVREFLRRDRERGTVVIISDLLDVEEDLAAALLALRLARNAVVVLHVTDVRDAAPVATGPVRLVHAETGGQVSVNLTDSVAAEYARRWERFALTVEKMCIRGGASHVPAPTREPFERIVLRVLRRL